MGSPTLPAILALWKGFVSVSNIGVNCRWKRKIAFPTPLQQEEREFIGLSWCKAIFQLRIANNTSVENRFGQINHLKLKNVAQLIG